MSRRRLPLACVIFLSILMLTTQVPSGQRTTPVYVPGELLLKFTPGAKASDKASARAQLNAARVRTCRSGAEHWRRHRRRAGVERVHGKPQRVSVRT